MKSNYKRIGDYIQLVDERNTNMQVEFLLGLSISKEFIPSVANLIGTDMKNYKIIRKNQFACSTMQVRRDRKMPIALLESFDEAIISAAYPVFEVLNKEVILPEYLMMWFRRKEFDREACFYAVGGVRGSIEWEDFCNMKLPVPPILNQIEIVKEYNVLMDRLKLNNRLILKLEETAQAVYKHWFVEVENENWEEKTLNDLCSLITDGKHGDCENEMNSGYYFVSVKDLSEGEIIYDNTRQITKRDFVETHRRTNLLAGDILLTNSGTIGRMAIVKDYPETNRTTFQKSVAILKPNYDVAPTFFLYSLLKSEIKNIIDLAGGSTQSNLLLGDLRSFKLKYSSKELIYEFENKVTSIFEMLSLKGKEQQKLLNIKDLLLSKLATMEDSL
jgi:type I restriction enzyme S subunit